MRYGISLPERLQKFRDLSLNIQANSISKHDVPTVNGTELHEVFLVSVDLPKYRINNTRTLAIQENFIFNNNKNEDFFSDVESDEVQEIQHNILKTLIKSTEKDKDLIAYFAANTQTEPLILTHDGFVISGNRRLCAFRELLGENGENYQKYKNFTQVRVVILPNLDPDQIDQIEDFLEQQTDIKEPFSWVSRALGYRNRIRRYGYSDDKLARIARVKKSEIRSLIDKLEIADRYLDSINKPKDYDQILDDFYAFEKIYSCQTKDKASPSKKTAFEKLSFISIKNKADFSDRMYKNIPIINEVRENILNEITYEFPSEIEKIERDLEKNIQFDTLNLSPDPTIPLIKLLDNQDNEEKIVGIISEKIEEHLALAREKKKKSSVLERVSKANTLLIEANQVKSSETDKKGVLNQIEQIEKQIDSLRGWASEI